MLITNETNNTNCATAGVFIIASLAGTLRRHRQPGRAAHAAMTRLAAYRTAGKPGEFHDADRVGGSRPHRRRLLGALVHGQGQHRRARQLRAGHALRRHLRPDEPAAGRLVPRPGAAPHERHAGESSPATPPAPTGTASTSTSPTTSAASTSSSSTTPSTAARSSRRPAGTPARDSQTVEPIDDEHRRRRRRHRAGDAGADAGHAGRRSAPFTPGVAKDYTASTTANVISTAGDAHAERRRPVARRPPATSSTARSRCRRRCRPRRRARPAPVGALADVGGSAAPTSLLTYSRPDVSNDAVTLAFQQHIGAGDALRTGAYSKTLTFTLSTTTP